MTKCEALRECLENKTPINESYENYITNFSEENVFTFEANEEKINVGLLIKELNEIGFIVLDSKKINGTHTFFRVKEIL